MTSQQSDNLVALRTSGSTGTPKTIWVERSRMEASARMTCGFLGLKAGDTALQCLSTDYIAGKMMQVRAEVWQLNLITVPTDGHPLRTVDTHIDFAAMVPLQVYNSLMVEEERRRLMDIRHLIIGGGAVHPDLEEKLRDFPNAVWSTYGMTETLSHIALRRLNGNDRSAWYTAMDGVEVTLSADGCLVIDAPAITATTLTTNDIAEVNPENSRQFRILGRKDNVVCSGGVKIQIEEVEAMLSGHIDCPFLVTKRPDRKFGEALVLVVEMKPESAELPEGSASPVYTPAPVSDQIAGSLEKVPRLASIKSLCNDILPPYWQPKEIVAFEHLPLTHSGKPDRRGAALLLDKI